MHQAGKRLLLCNSWWPTGPISETARLRQDKMGPDGRDLGKAFVLDSVAGLFCSNPAADPCIKC